MNYYIIVLYYRHERKAVHQGYAVTEVQTVTINRYAVSNKLLYCTVLYCTVYCNTVVTEEARWLTSCKSAELASR